MVEDRITAIEKKIPLIEKDLVKIRQSLHRVRGEAQKMVAKHTVLQSEVSAIKMNTDRILVFVTGANKVYGVARKHWKTGLTFGCGLITAIGAGNPTVARTVSFVGTFFGIH